MFVHILITLFEHSYVFLRLRTSTNLHSWGRFEFLVLATYCCVAPAIILVACGGCLCSTGRGKRHVKSLQSPGDTARSLTHSLTHLTMSLRPKRNFTGSTNTIQTKLSHHIKTLSITGPPPASLTFSIAALFCQRQPPLSAPPGPTSNCCSPLLLF